MTLSDLGKVADSCWRAIPKHMHGWDIDAYVVMPDHIHGIIYGVTSPYTDSSVDGNPRNSRDRHIPIQRCRFENRP
jgi:REP element-mobilizing transposase RayT